MKKLIVILLAVYSINCTAQTDSLELYKRGYSVAKELNLEYKVKIESMDGVLQELQLQTQDLTEIIKTNDYILYNDSLQLDIQTQQIKLLNDNLNIYQKEFNRRNKFWNKPVFGIILGMVGTVTLIHVIDYSLPQ